jgi:hypothetical protein
VELELRRWLQQIAAGTPTVAIAAPRDEALAPPYLHARARTYVAVKDPRTASSEEIAANLRRGAVVVSNGPQIVLEVAGRRPGDRVTLVRRAAAPRAVTVTAAVHAPDWMALDTLTILVNGVPWGQPLAVGEPRDHGLRLRTAMSVPLPRDSSVIALVRGSAKRAPGSAATVTVLAVTNPVWIDADGDGRVDAR